MPAISGFYACPACTKLHTFSGGFTIVECSCGERLDQLEIASSCGEIHLYGKRN